MDDAHKTNKTMRIHSPLTTVFRGTLSDESLFIKADKSPTPVTILRSHHHLYWRHNQANFPAKSGLMYTLSEKNLEKQHTDKIVPSWHDYAKATSRKNLFLTERLIY